MQPFTLAVLGKASWMQTGHPHRIWGSSGWTQLKHPVCPLIHTGCSLSAASEAALPPELNGKSKG